MDRVKSIESQAGDENAPPPPESSSSSPPHFSGLPLQHVDFYDQFVSTPSRGTFSQEKLVSSGGSSPGPDSFDKENRKSDSKVCLSSSRESDEPSSDKKDSERSPVTILKRPCSKERLARLFGFDSKTKPKAVFFRDLNGNCSSQASARQVMSGPPKLGHSYDLGTPLLRTHSSKERNSVIRVTPRCVSDPLGLQRKQKKEKWAGPGYSKSPSPSALPLPSFQSAQQRQRDVHAATRTLRRALNLEED